jgi:hypothetical protein
MPESSALSHADRRKRLERAVFERFCAAAGFAIIEIVQPEPPAPERRAILVGRGAVKVSQAVGRAEAMMIRSNTPRMRASKRGCSMKVLS